MERLTYPSCEGRHVVKNGRIHNSKQLIDKLPLEKFPLAGIVRVVEVSESWLQTNLRQYPI